MTCRQFWTTADGDAIDLTYSDDFRHVTVVNHTRSETVTLSLDLVGAVARAAVIAQNDFLQNRRYASPVDTIQ